MFETLFTRRISDADRTILAPDDVIRILNGCRGLTTHEILAQLGLPRRFLKLLKEILALQCRQNLVRKHKRPAFKYPRTVYALTNRGRSYKQDVEPGNKAQKPA